MRHQLSLRSICRFGAVKEDGPGSIESAFNHELASAFGDCMNRPEDNKARKVMLLVEISPADVQRGQCSNVEVDFHVKTQIPARKSMGNKMQVIEIDGELQAVFNDAALDDPRQSTLDEVAAPPAGEEKPYTVKLSRG